MWGQVKKGKLNFGEIRIIPTRVGTSDCPHFREFVIKDHPHACGDKMNGAENKNEVEGSSPRVWGQEV